MFESDMTIKRICIINGANLNLLGTREPEKYGTRDFNTFLELLKSAYPNVTINYYQSNVEGELVNMIQEKGAVSEGIILNAGGYSHTSIVIADAVKAVRVPVIEVHITNIHAREPQRRNSLLSAYCKGTVTGLGLEGYETALLFLAGLLKTKQATL